MHLDARLGVGRGVGVAADVGTTVEDENLEVLLGGSALGDREPEEAGAEGHGDKISHTSRLPAVDLPDRPRNADSFSCRAPRRTDAARER